MQIVVRWNGLDKVEVWMHLEYSSGGAAERQFLRGYNINYVLFESGDIVMYAGGYAPSDVLREYHRKAPTVVNGHRDRIGPGNNDPEKFKTGSWYKVKFRAKSQYGAFLGRPLPVAFEHAMEVEVRPCRDGHSLGDSAYFIINGRDLGNPHGSADAEDFTGTFNMMTNPTLGAFIVSDEVKLAAVRFGSGSNLMHFKHTIGDLKKGDSVVVADADYDPDKPLHTMVGVVTDPDVAVNFNNNTKVGWIVQRVDLVSYKELLKREKAIIETLGRAEKESYRNALRKTMQSMLGDQMEGLALTGPVPAAGPTVHKMVGGEIVGPGTPVIDQ